MKHIIQSGLGLKFINHQTYLVILDEVARVGVSPGPHSIFSNHNYPASQKAQEGVGQWAITSSSCSLSPPIM